MIFNPYVAAEIARDNREREKTTALPGVTVLPRHVKAMKSIPLGYFLAGMVAISARHDHEEFKLSDTDICRMMGMTIRQLQTIRRKLLQTKIFTIERKGFPARAYYSINRDIYLDAVGIRC